MLQRQALDVRRRVLGPDHPDTAGSLYSLACLAALRGKSHEALSFLGEAIDHGLDPATDLGIGKDPNLKSLHGDPRFEAFVAHAKERVAAVQKKQ